MPSQLGMKFSLATQEGRSDSRSSAAVPNQIVSETNQQRQPPRLLVSVRSADEASTAIAGGADILDVKEPTAGSLGMAPLGQIFEIAKWLDSHDHSLSLSVALGETAEWMTDSSVPVLPESVTYAKLGLSGLGSRVDWSEPWCQVRSRFDEQRSKPLNWVAVAYADAKEAASPHVRDVLNAAIETDCSGFLIDTWTKDGRTLLDEMDQTSLQSIAQLCKEAGLFLALAGRLNQGHLEQLREIELNIVAIRSAGCVGSDRTSVLDLHRVQAFRSELHRIWQPVGPKSA